MPRGKKVPKWGRSREEITRDLHGYAADVPLGNTDPTVVYGKLYGGMPNKSRTARGGLKTQKGKRR